MVAVHEAVISSSTFVLCTHPQNELTLIHGQQNLHLRLNIDALRNNVSANRLDVDARWEDSHAYGRDRNGTGSDGQSSIAECDCRNCREHRGSLASLPHSLYDGMGQIRDTLDDACPQLNMKALLDTMQALQARHGNQALPADWKKTRMGSLVS